MKPAARAPRCHSSHTHTHSSHPGARDVATALGNAQTTQAQFDALVSFHYNTGAIARSTLLRLHRAGKYGEAAAEFARWNRAGGRILKGLVRRRKAEAALYRSQ